MVKSWNKKKVRDLIIGRHKQGQKINSGYVQVHQGKLYQAGMKYFGSWRKAVEAAGFDYDKLKSEYKRPKKYSDKFILNELRKIYKEEGKINSNHAQTKHPAFYALCVKRFGSWRKAVEAAGFDYENISVKTHQFWTKELIIAEAFKRYKNSLPMNGYAVSIEDGRLYKAVRRHFGLGGWKKVIEQLGIDYDEIDPRVVWTKKDIQTEILRLHNLGIPIFGYFLTTHGYASLVSSGRKKFGSWRKTIESVGLNYEKIRAIRMNYWTPDRVIEEIKRLAESGVRLSLKNTQRKRADLIGAAIKHFESWDRAVEAAGLRYREHCLRWSSKAWLNKLTDKDVREIDERYKKLKSIRRKKKGR